MELAKFYDLNGDTINCFVQWDSNLYVTFDGSFEGDVFVDYCNVDSADSYRIQAEPYKTNMYKVKVPNILLIEPNNILAFVYVSDSSSTAEDEAGKTVSFINVPVRQKPKPDDFVLDDDVQYISIVRLKAELSKLRQDVYSEEAVRNDAEDARKSSEITRVSNEVIRMTNEQLRNDAETSRVDQFENMKIQCNNAVTIANTSNETSKEALDKINEVHESVNNLNLGVRTVSFSSGVNENIASGETLSEMFGKINTLFTSILERLDALETR